MTMGMDYASIILRFFELHGSTTTRDLFRRCKMSKHGIYKGLHDLIESGDIISMKGGRERSYRLTGIGRRRLELASLARKTESAKPVIIEANAISTAELALLARIPMDRFVRVRDLEGALVSLYRNTNHLHSLGLLEKGEKVHHARTLRLHMTYRRRHHLIHIEDGKLRFE